MIDFAKISETVGAWVSGAGVAEAVGESALPDLLARAGLDADALAGLSEEGLLSHLQTLAENGELPAEIAQLAGTEGAGEGIAGILQKLTGER